MYKRPGPVYTWSLHAFSLIGYLSFAKRFHLFSLVSLSFWLTFSFIRGSLCIGLLKRDSATHPRHACCISAINPYPGYYNTPYSLLHTFIILTFGEVYNLHTWFQQPVQFGQKRFQTSSWSGLSDRNWMCLGCVSDVVSMRLESVSKASRRAFTLGSVLHTSLNNLRWFENSFQIF